MGSDSGTPPLLAEVPVESPYRKGYKKTVYHCTGLDVVPMQLDHPMFFEERHGQFSDAEEREKRKIARAEMAAKQSYVQLGVRLDMTRFVLLSVLIAFTTLLAAASQTLAPQGRSRALHDPHDSLWSQPAPSIYRVRIETTKGIILLDVARELAPRGADRFYHLVQVGFYDNSRFFRVISRRFAQFGIAGDPAIAKTWQNERFPDDPVKDSNVRGTFAFAMPGPDARTTQIYINTGDQSRLDPMGFAPFGKVVEGMSVIDKLYADYGETSGGGMRAGHQGKLFEEGNAYLDREFPLLDRLVHAEIIEEQK